MSQDLSIIVPVYNEERTLSDLMIVLHTACPHAQIVFVDDGSTDASATILKQHARPQDIVLHKDNGGKGSAIRLGLAHVTGAYTVIQDSDLEYDPMQIPSLVDAARAHPHCAIFGSRFMTKNPNIYRRFLWGNKVLTWVMNCLYRSHLTDSYTCYKLLPTSVFQDLNLTSNGFELEAEICCRCLSRGVKIVEIPITYRPRTLEDGKKIRFKDAWKGLTMMLRLRLSLAGGVTGREPQ